jgi:hypothetical protein
MEQEQLAEDFGELLTLVTGLRQERNELRLRIRLARCGIQKEWEKAENKWGGLRAENDLSLSKELQLARELKSIYIRMYRGLMMKSSNLLKQLNGMEQLTKPGNTVALDALKRQVTEEIATIRLKLETLSGTAAEIVQTPADEEPVCACLKCQQDTGRQPFDLNQVPGIH